MDSSLGGNRLGQYLGSFAIEELWISGHPVIWQTGQQDGLESDDPASHSTHCSAFIAAVALGLNLYVLRPRQHKLKLLSNAQVEWLLGEPIATAPSAAASGWQTLGTAGDAGVLERAVESASLGSLVIAGYRNRDPAKPGHLVAVLPVSDDFGEEGPQVISVATKNRSGIAMREAFKAHPEAWPDNVHLFLHKTDLEVGAVRDGGSSAPMP